MAGHAFIPIEQVRNQTSDIILIIIFLAVSWFAMSLRLFTRGFIMKSYGWDDLAMFITGIFFTVYCGAAVKTVITVSGKKALTIHQLTTAINWLLVTEVFYIITMLTLKISLGIFFLRITIKRWHHRLIYVTVAISTLFGLAYFLFVVFQCGYISNAFTFFIRKETGKCITRAQNLGMGFTHATITTVTDVTFATLPLAILRGSNMNKREKFIVGFILLLGATGGIASMVRFKFIEDLAEPGKRFFASTHDVLVWSTIEPGLGIIAGSLATLRPLFRQFVHKARSLRSSRAGSSMKSPFESKRVSSEASNRRPSHASDVEMLPQEPAKWRDGSISNNYPNTPLEPYEYHFKGELSPSSLYSGYDLEGGSGRPIEPSGPLPSPPPPSFAFPRSVGHQRNRSIVRFETGPQMTPGGKLRKQSIG